MTNEKLSIPSQVFKWFEKMKSNYERNIVSVLDRFERTTKEQQKRVDDLHLSAMENLSDSHEALVNSQQQQIEQLKKDIHFYQTQVSQQQQMIDQLNQRYDTVIAKLFIDSNSSNTLKDIEDVVTKPTFDDKDNEQSFITKLLNEATEPVPQNQNSRENKSNIEDYFQQAMLHREQKEYTQAVEYFEKAAELKHAKAMGALGRAYFLAEGVDENPVMGLHWLIKAAEHGLPQAQARVDFYKENEPDLYYLAIST